MVPWGSGEMVDAHALGACAARREGSSPSFPTTFNYVTSTEVEVQSNGGLTATLTSTPFVFDVARPARVSPGLGYVCRTFTDS